MTQAFQRGRDRPLSRAQSRHQTMDRSNRNQTFERAQWHQADCDHGCRASLPESEAPLWHSASFRYYGPAKGGHQTFEQVRSAGVELTEIPVSRHFDCDLLCQVGITSALPKLAGHPGPWAINSKRDDVAPSGAPSSYFAQQSGSGPQVNLAHV